MSDRIGRFRPPDAAEEYYRIYDAMVERHWPVPSDELDVPTRFGPTHVRRSGPNTGTPIVLLHANGGSSLGWHPLVSALAEHHPLYTPDTIGTAGRSVQAQPIGTAADLSVWLDEVLDSLGLDRIHFGGYSEGGWIAGVHATHTQRRDRLASLTLIEPAGAIERMPRRTVATLVLRGMSTLSARDKRRAIRDFNRWMNGDVEITDDEAELVMFVFKHFRQKLPNPDRLSDQQLRSITTPTLLLLAENTKIYDPARVEERARRLLPDVTIDVTPDAGHGLVFQYPERITDLILEFIACRETEETQPNAGQD
jgi:pimeloyl-ACP methyl ester carboxylesterase